VANGERFEIVAGERRFRAAKLAGVERVPVVVRERPSDRQLLELALVENLQRENLNAMEESEAFGRLREEFDLSQEEIANRVGKDRTTVANSLRLLKLHSDVKEMIRAGALSGGHARAIASLPNPDEQHGLAEEVVRRGLSVRQTEKRAAQIAGRSPGEPGQATRPVHPRRRGEAFPAPADSCPNRPTTPRRPRRARLLFRGGADGSLRQAREKTREAR
jgi:ParB family chromosome partitioning protein